MSNTLALRAAALAAALVLAPFAAGASAPTVVVEDGYVRSVPAEWKTTAAYMTLRNTSDKPLVLVGAESPLCTRIELHARGKDRHGKPQMKPAKQFVIEPHKEYILTPGGDHLMMVGLARELEPGAKVPLTLRFETQTLQVDLPAAAKGTLQDLASAPGNPVVRRPVPPEWKGKPQVKKE